MGRLGEVYTIQPDPFGPSTTPVLLRVCLFRDVQNLAELRKRLDAGDLSCSLLRADTILAMFQLLVAANRALHYQAQQKMKTKSIHTELVYSLSPTKNISESLQTFGANDSTKDVIVAVFGDKSGSVMKDIAKVIKGKAVPLRTLGDVSNSDLIKKVRQQPS
ncbi:unnamed protein product [Soboliphyme baturini]|uniref:EKC/KEOPS complex subunit cgi121 n=1 Tax=Soboliphyme baturini TaxID=241478 RepID=A0A183J1W5_9BILA|nr:unnamed protein product [Soboliphyme baturini]